MDSVVAIVQSVAPFIALVWAIYAFYDARKSDRDDALRVERQSVYQSYLKEIHALQRPHRTLVENGAESFSRLSPHHQMVALIAPDPVARASLEYLSTFIGSHLYKDDQPMIELSERTLPVAKKDIDEVIDAMEPTRSALKALIIAMRKDTLQGTKVDPRLTDIDELEKRIGEEGRPPEQR